MYHTGLNLVRRHEKLKGPKRLSQEVRDTAVIHNQASLRPCVWQRGITPVLSTGVNAAVLYTKQGILLPTSGHSGNPKPKETRAAVRIVS